MISCTLLVNGVLDNNLEVSVNTTERSLGFVLVVSMALSYLEEVNSVNFPIPTPWQRPGSRRVCHPANNFMSPKTPENIIRDISAVWRPMRSLGIQNKTKACLIWGDQGFQLGLQARCGTWDGTVQDKELSSVIFVSPFQFCIFCGITCPLVMVKNTGGFLIDGIFCYIVLLSFPCVRRLTKHSFLTGGTEGRFILIG